ncbi:MAG TPA: 4-hydroxy-tetrahydrodipicolinate synthase [Cyclobacteriaceae bacterium]|nr:4-hydroxy-tetrahydrodipicolinate synthase [Cyclobacteriaceae bacterium]HMV10403.1 4-hydroxy-tetrahydrodipicolinate synthase [Cyclobacteriaceae bacterium]HMV90778.1 4-hydroxy-tetrahydrodipicolinate synthase [Cyclobacteriaceae bacterium]HMX00428.1 4-hydroxy-tetrahydrodipicolinate synthase [Cyclobacteriaceae bacterium]HMX50488.1 4-hydroxy-tetrahydrodipicolinate synthase [Cyclobacteriaceae bacterium]
MKKFFGTGVALITPFTSTGSVDYKSLKKVLQHTGKGVDYYVVMGTTGESATLSHEEKKAVLQFVIDNNPKKLPVVFGIGGNNTKEVIDTIKSANFEGVDALLSVSPYYNKPSQEGIYQHFKAVAGASPVPVILYNVPGRTASNIAAETTLRLAAHKNIFAVKEASGNIEQCMKIAKAMPKDFLLISGDDLLTVPLYSIGAKGVISVLANAYPVVFQKMKEFSFAGDFAKASKEQFKILEINGPMYEEGNPVGVKQLMADMGLCGNHVRLPLVEASEGLKRKIRLAAD